MMVGGMCEMKFHPRQLDTGHVAPAREKAERYFSHKKALRWRLEPHPNLKVRCQPLSSLVKSLNGGDSSVSKLTRIVTTKTMIEVQQKDAILWQTIRD